MENRILLFIVIAGLILLGINPESDRATWAMEISPVVIIVALVVSFQARLKLTTWVLRFMVLHAFVLMVGGFYTYAKVPAGFWVQDLFELSRNPYDRVGHFFQGFVPALLFRELLLRHSQVRSSKLMSLITISFCLSFSAIYELLEWLVAVIMGQGAEDFLGTQGDIWDTQWDMFMALIGASLATALFSRWQDRTIKPVS